MTRVSYMSKLNFYGGEKVMGLFTKYCEVCGRKIERGNDIVRFGKHFDSEEHAQQYAKEMEMRRRMGGESPARRSPGGCC